MNNSSSSNPFRRSVHSSEYTSAGSRPLPGADADADTDAISYTAAASSTDHDPALHHRHHHPKLAISTTTTTKKQVRISSPPRSPNPRREDAQPNAGPSLASQEPGAYYDGFAHPQTRHPPNRRGQGHTSSGGEDEDDSSSDGTDDDTTAVTTAGESRPTSNAPHNPFSRTLKDMEESLGTSTHDKTPGPAESSGQQGTTSARTAMDVNAFKNLLMTGKPPPNAPELSVPPPHKPAALTLADNSSGTDTSSVSRQSLVDNMAGETPRTSYERSISDEEEEAARLPQRTASKRVKPPLPRHRHGKSVTSTGPQIVSFNDFTTARPEQSITSPTEDKPSRSSAEFRRPLPPIPQPAPRAEPVIPAVVPVLVAEPKEISSSSSPDVTEQAPQSHKKPPPPPLARRSSQRLPAPTASKHRNSSSSTRPSLMEDNESIAESTTSSTRIAPPPPPARRSGHASHHTTAGDEGSPSSIHRAPSIKSPPPPPARNRASSNLSSTSIPSNISTTPTSATHPPPRPPPRRNSSRSSLDMVSPRRTSGELVRASFDSERRPSISSSVRRVPITEEPAAEDSSAIAPDSAASSSAKDILADMEKFQKEIDALMARDELGKRKGSAGSASLTQPASQR